MTQTSDAETIERSVTRRRGREIDDGPEIAGVGPTDRRYRRRPALIGLGVGLLAVCGAGAAYLTELTSDTTEVLAVADDVHRGQVIADADLAVAQAASDPAVASVPAGERATIVGQRAAADLTAGTLLTSSAVTSEGLPSSGQTIVGVAVTGTQLPQHDMVPGDNVRIFDTPNAGDDPPADAPPSIPATVVSVSGLTDSGHVVVDVVVDDDVAGELVARVATGRVAIVLDSAEGDEERG